MKTIDKALDLASRQDAEITRLRALVTLMSKALHEGYHSGFCNGPCPTCDQYQAAMAAADAYAIGEGKLKTSPPALGLESSGDAGQASLTGRCRESPSGPLSNG